MVLDTPVIATFEDPTKEEMLEVSFPIGECRRVCYVAISSDLMDSDKYPGAVNLILDFLNDCTIIREQKDIFGGEVIRFLIAHKDLPKLGAEQLSDIPYYSVQFRQDGSYYFRKVDVKPK